MLAYVCSEIITTTLSGLLILGCISVSDQSSAKCEHRALGLHVYNSIDISMGSGTEVFAFLSFARPIKAFSTKNKIIVRFRKLISHWMSSPWFWDKCANRKQTVTLFRLASCQSPTALKRPNRSKQRHCLQITDSFSNPIFFANALSNKFSFAFLLQGLFLITSRPYNSSRKWNASRQNRYLLVRLFNIFKQNISHMMLKYS